MKKFTLIELLVVVAIIGILASMLLPVLGKARKTSQIAVSKNNLKQIMVADTMYADDNDGWLTYSERFHYEGGFYKWPIPVYEYLSGKKMASGNARTQEMKNSS